MLDDYGKSQKDTPKMTDFNRFATPKYAKKLIWPLKKRSEKILTDLPEKHTPERYFMSEFRPDICQKLKITHRKIIANLPKPTYIPRNIIAWLKNGSQSGLSPPSGP